MSEDHCADRKDRRCDPNDDGGPLLGNAWDRFHDHNNRNVIIRFLRSTTASAGSPFRPGVARRRAAPTHARDGRRGYFPAQPARRL